jgi:hypothetical protein
MMSTTVASPRPATLLLILIAAVVQGWALYGLHTVLENDWWPASHPPALIALYTIAVFIPTTVQLLAQLHRQRLFWPAMAALALVFGYFGWHHGAVSGDDFVAQESLGGIAIAVTLVVLWLMLLPFLANRLREGRWLAGYPDFFTTAWHNKLLLAEAALFAIVFWLLLGLWATLFRLLGIDFFQELFRQPVFIYPVTGIVFGLALYLIGSVERFVAVVLEQILGLFKWLAVIAGLILTLFSVALLFRLPVLIGSSTRVIGAAWLLWLLAVMILLLNAAYRDGTNARPYPAPLAAALRYITPAMVLVAVVALYSLAIRVEEYGLTTERIWALIVAVAGVLYAVGYAVAAFRSGPWMAGIGKVNVFVAFALIVTLALTLTPLLSPYRLAAASQYDRIIEGRADSAAAPYQNDSYRSLRFSMGRYGRERLEQLAALQDHPEAEAIRERASVALAANEYWAAPVNALDLDRLQVFPVGRTLDEGLRTVLGPVAGSRASQGEFFPGCTVPDAPCAGLYIDLNADGSEEFLLFSPYLAWVFRREGEGWQRDTTASLSVGGEMQPLLNALAAGDFGTEASRYRDLRIGDRVLEIFSAPSLSRGPVAVPAIRPDPEVPFP